MTDASPLRFKRLTIEQLFGPGSSDIDIPFNLGQRVTVLHGRNGSGKTITLGLIDALRNENFDVFLRYPFKKFTLELSDGTSLELERVAADELAQRSDKKGRRPTKPAGTLRWMIRSADGKQLTDVLSARETALSQEELHRAIKPYAPWLEPVGRNLWIDVRHDLSLTTDDVVRRYGEMLEPRILRWLRQKQRLGDTPLSQLLERLPAVKFIKADRLFVRGTEIDLDPHPRRQRRVGLMVERLSQDIRELVVQADREYRLISTRLDSSLANRLFKRHKDIPSLEELRARSESLRAQATRLKELGLLREDPAALDEAALNGEQKGTFFIILKDSEEKLRPFAAVLDKAQRLLQSLNRKLAPKSVRLNVDTGYQILAASGSELPLECLSSGEQHELVLLHELLFDVQPGSLILIDEPELSLHVTWQVDVLPDLLDIAKLSELDFVLATHSPYIVKDHDDLMVRLGEPV